MFLEHQISMLDWLNKHFLLSVLKPVWSDCLFLFKWAVLGQNKLQWGPSQKSGYGRLGWHNAVSLETNHANGVSCEDNQMDETR